MISDVITSFSEGCADLSIEHDFHTDGCVLWSHGMPIARRVDRGVKVVNPLVNYKRETSIHILAVLQAFPTSYHIVAEIDA